MSNPFDYFDKIVCICEHSEISRWQSVSVEFKKFGIDNRVTRFGVKIDQKTIQKFFDKNKKLCKKSFCHWSVLNEARHEKRKNVLIFESDIKFIENDFKSLTKSIDYIKSKKWKLFYLGGVPHNIFEIHTQSVFSGSLCQAHAYAVNGNYFDEIIAKIQTSDLPIDQVYRRDKKYNIAEYSFATIPRFAIQNDTNKKTRKNYSNIMWKKIVDPMITMYNEKYKIITTPCDHASVPDRKILNNFKKSCDEVGILASHGHIKNVLINCEKKYPILNEIHKVISTNFDCWYINNNSVVIKDFRNYIKNLIKHYDLIILSSTIYNTNLTRFKKILSINFCVVKSSNLTKKLFDTTHAVDPLYKGRCVEEVYFNSKLNMKDYSDLRVKVLSESDFANSMNNKGCFGKKLNPYIVNYDESMFKNNTSQEKIQNMKQNKHWVLES